MKNFKICRLCCQSVLEDNIQIISEIHTEILEILLIKLDLTVSEQPMICHICCEQLQKSFDFKSKCIENEDSLMPLLKNGEISDVSDLATRNLKVKNGKNQTVCRMCVNITKEKFELNDNEEITFQNFLPEINLKNNLSTAMCSVCYESFQNYSKFAAKCLEWDDKLKQYIKIVGLRKKRKFSLDNFLQNIDKLIKLGNKNNTDMIKENKETFHVDSIKSEIIIKHEVTEVEEASCDSFLNNFEDKNDETHEINRNSIDRNSDGKKKQFKCKQCPFESDYKYYMKNHELMHEGKRKEYKKKIQEFKCSICSFVTKYKNYLAKHELLHSRDGEKFQCPECHMETSYKECLLKHLQTVHNPDAAVFMCNDCDFKTKHKISIIRHVQIHRPKKVLSCDLCDYETLYPARFELHVCKMKKKPQKFPCDMCSHITTRKRALREHKRLIHNVGEQHIYKCNICGFFTKTKPILRKHLKAHQNKSKSALYKCPQCDFKTFDTHCLRKHVSTHREDLEIDVKECIFESYEVEKKFKCSDCDAAFVREKTLIRHQIVHSRERPFKCKLCPYRSKTMKTMYEHKNSHKDYLIECENCDFKTKTTRLLKIHMIKHQDKPKLYTCKLCKFESKWRSSYEIHMKSIHLLELYSCKKCDFQTPHKRTILNHQLVHDKNKLPLLKCSECEFKTRRKDCFKAHMLVHKDSTEVTMFKCTECQFETKYRRSLRNHIRDIHENKGKKQKNQNKENDDHDDAQKIKCPKCPYRAPSIGLLNKHIARKHSTKTFKCDQCDFSTTVMYNLRGHRQRMHVNVEVFKCNLCDFQTRHKKSLKNHISNKHEQWMVLEINGHKQIKRRENTITS